MALVLFAFGLGFSIGISSTSLQTYQNYSSEPPCPPKAVTQTTNLSLTITEVTTQRPGEDFGQIVEAMVKPLNERVKALENGTLVSGLERRIKILETDVNMKNDEKEEQTNQMTENEMLQESVHMLKNFIKVFCEGSDIRNAYKLFYDCSDRFEYIMPRRVKNTRKIMLPEYNNTGRKVGVNGMYFYANDFIDIVVLYHFFLHPQPVFDGAFLEIGAMNGLSASNTLVFERNLGWSGLLFEPTTCAEACRENRPRSHCFQMGLCSNMTNFTSNNFGSCHGVDTYCAPLFECGLPIGNIDFLSIDVEGAEMEVLHAIDWDAIQAKVVVVEYRKKYGSHVDYMKQFGFEFIDLIKDELFWHPDRVKPHIFPRNFLGMVPY